MRLGSFLWRQLPEYRPRMIGVLGLLLLASAVPACSVWALQALLQAALEGIPHTALRFGALLLALQVLDVGLRLLRTRLTKQLAWELTLRHRVTLHRRWLGVNISRQPPPGVTQAALLEAADDVQYGVSAVVGRIRDPLMLLGLFGVCLALSPWLTLVAVLLALPLTRALPWAGRRVRGRVAEVHAARGRLSKLVAEDLRRVEVLQAFDGVGAASVRFAVGASRDAEARADLDTERLLPASVAQLLVAALVVVLVVGGALEVAAGRLEGAQLVAFGVALGLIRRPMQGLSESGVLARRCSVALDLLSHIPAPPIRLGEEEGPAGALTVHVNEVAVSHGDQSLLRAVSLSIRAGEWVALVGPTGSGKTTLLRAVAGLLRVSGEVHVGGVEVKNWRHDVLRRRIGWVPQADVTGAETVRQALLIGREGFGDDALWQALTTAQLASKVRSLPQQLDSPLAALGRDLSGGELQRLFLARALLARPDLLLLDEPAAALDDATAKRLLAALRGLPWAPTVVVATHHPLFRAAVDSVVPLVGPRLDSATS